MSALRLTVLSGMSVTLCREVLDAVVRDVAGAVAVVCSTEDLATRSLVGRRVYDASGLLESEQIVLEHGCVSCTLYEELLPALARLADLGRWSAAVVALPACVEPASLADAIAAAPLLHDILHVDTVATVVDAALLRHQMSRDDLLDDLGLSAARTDRRSVAEVLSRGVEYADVIVVDNVDRLSREAATRAQLLLAHLAPHARQLVRGEHFTAADVVSTALFHHASASARAAPGTPVSPGREPAARDSVVVTAVWRATRPVDPGALAERLPWLVAHTQRCRGHLWMATRPAEALGFESWGRSASLGSLGPWVTTAGSQPGASVLPAGLHADSHTDLDSGSGARGAPCCHLSLTGIALDETAVIAALDSCLIDEELMSAGPAAWSHLLDPFTDHECGGAEGQNGDGDLAGSADVTE